MLTAPRMFDPPTPNAVPLAHVVDDRLLLRCCVEGDEVIDAPEHREPGARVDIALLKRHHTHLAADAHDGKVPVHPIEVRFGKGVTKGLVRLALLARLARLALF